MTERTECAGGYLVTSEVSSELIQLRQNAGVLRPIMQSVAVSSDTLSLFSQAGGLTAGWVAELASKPAADMAFASFNVSVFTAAGLAVVSNKLPADAGVG